MPLLIKQVYVYIEKHSLQGFGLANIVDISKQINSNFIHENYSQPTYAEGEIYDCEALPQ